MSSDADSIQYRASFTSLPCAVNEAHELIAVAPTSSSDEDTSMRLAADSLREVMELVWQSNERRLTPKQAMVRFAALTALTAPGVFDFDSYDKIGARVGVGRAQISHAALRISDALNLRFRRQRSPQTRTERAKITAAAWREKE